MADGPATPSHLILVGVPGAGKSTVAPILAALLDRRWLDFDAELERREGLKVAAIFAERGEEGFRALEQGLTRELRDSPPMVLAPGGGWVTRPQTVALLRPPSRLVYLRVATEVALGRMGAEVTDRPLLDPGDPGGALERLLAAREAHYAHADHVVDVDLLTPQRVATTIADWARAGETRPTDESRSHG